MLRQLFCRVRRTGEQKIILYGEAINAKDSNRRVLKFPASQKQQPSEISIFQDVNPGERLLFAKNDFDTPKTKHKKSKSKRFKV